MTTNNQETHRCDSCTMPIESGQYCQYCSDASGNLKPFDDRFESMIGFVMRRDSNLSRPEAEQQTLAFMAELPAWRNHPELLARLKT